MSMPSYYDFLRSKMVIARKSGFTINAADLHPSNMPHQRDIITWALDGGNRAIFSKFGTGKTQMQLEICRLSNQHYGGRSLIIAPLGVRQEFTQKDGPRLGSIPKYITCTEDVLNNEDETLFITNYERVRDGAVDVNLFTTITLDEAAVLRSFGSKTYQTFLGLFANVPHKYVCTAVPSPNRLKELIHYAGFLGVMDTGQALTRFFQRNSSKAGDLTLYPHKEQEFWLWVKSWAIFLDKPSDLGHSDKGFDLPPLNVVTHRIVTDQSGAVDKNGRPVLFRDSAVSLSQQAREKRDTIELRIDKVKEIMAGYPEGTYFILWHHLDTERDAIQKQILGVSTVSGNMPLDKREQIIIDFSEGKLSILSTKPQLSGSGCNFQKHCHVNIFVGINDKFHDIIQAIHRTHRYGQPHQVDVHLIHTDAEDRTYKNFRRKWREYDDTVATMKSIVKKYGLTNNKIEEQMMRTIGVDRSSKRSVLYEAIHNDTVEETASMNDNAVDHILTSIPFSNHYEYTPSYNDFGHNTDDKTFFEQMDFLVPNLLRVLKPGRIAAIHVKDRIEYGSVTGYGMYTVNEFSDKTVQSFKKHGFRYCGRITVVTDVVRENDQTHRLGWTENAKDSTKMGCGSNEYVLLFRKPQSNLAKGYADERVTKDKEEYTLAPWQPDASGFWRSSGERLLTPEEITGMDHDRIIDWWKSYSLAHIYSYKKHVVLARIIEKKGLLPSTFSLLATQSWHPYVWTDVNRMLTLNTSQSQKNQQYHVCPLQFDIVDRCITRFTNPGELVYDPFAGLFTVPYRAILLGRRGKGVELNAGYYADGLHYLLAAEHKLLTPTLFSVNQIHEDQLVTTKTA